MIDDWVPILIEKRKLGIGCRSASVLRPIDFVATRVLALLALRREEDRVVVALRIVVWLVLVVLPLLDKQYARFRAGMRLECIAVQPDDGEDAAAFRDEATDVLVRRIVEASLRKDDGHASAGAEEVDVALDEKDVAPDAALRLAVLVAEVVARQQLPFLHLTGEWRISHHDVELKISVRRVDFEFAQLLVALVVCVDPRLIFRHGIPAAEVESVEVKNIGVSVSSDQIQCAGDADGLFVEVDCKNFLANIVNFGLSLRRGREKVADLTVRGKLHLTPDVKYGVDWKS